MAPLRRISDRATFEALRRRGRRVRRGAVTVTWLDSPDDRPPRVAYAVGRAVGGAVTRNRVRRRLRAVMAEQASELPPGAYLVGASPAAVSLTFDEMRSTVSVAIASLRSAPRASTSRHGGST